MEVATAQGNIGTRFTDKFVNRRCCVRRERTSGLQGDEVRIERTLVIFQVTSHHCASSDFGLATNDREFPLISHIQSLTLGVQRAFRGVLTREVHALVEVERTRISQARYIGSAVRCELVTIVE